jgi:hypothetical protein
VEMRETYKRNLSGPREAKILPDLVHEDGGRYFECLRPEQCALCAPKLAVRQAFLGARGELRARLRRELAEARRQDAAEANRARPAHLRTA